MQARATALEEDGHTVMLVNQAADWVGLLSLADVLRPNAAAVVAQLQELGLAKVGHAHRRQRARGRAHWGARQRR